MGSFKHSTGLHQPDDGKDENCVLSKFGLWHDYPCHYTFNIMCESGEQEGATV